MDQLKKMYLFFLFPQIKSSCTNWSGSEPSALCSLCLQEVIGWRASRRIKQREFFVFVLMPASKFLAASIYIKLQPARIRFFFPKKLCVGQHCSTKKIIVLWIIYTISEYVNIFIVFRYQYFEKSYEQTF